MNSDTKKLYELLHVAFVWSDTPQGAYYWVTVARNLQSMLEEKDND